MDSGESALPECISPNNFPAKLWRLVNNPAYEAIGWDSFGRGIVIDQLLFESQILSPGALLSDAFKTSNFSSFVRQLNLYGFRKADRQFDHKFNQNRQTLHHFYNINFQRNHPALLVNLRRLTVDNKAKLQAGLNVNCRPPSRTHLLGGGDEGTDVRVKSVKRESTSQLSPTHQESTRPYLAYEAQVLKVHNGTPVPPRYLVRGHGAALLPAIFATDKEIPGSSGHHYTGVASSSNDVHIQQGLLNRTNHGSQHFTCFSPPNGQYQPGFYSPVCNCYHPNLVAPHMAGGGLQTGLFSPQSYHQAGYPVNVLYHGDYKQDQEVKNCNVNLDMVFQIADQVMQTPPNNVLIKVETPEKLVSVSQASSNTCNTTLHDSAMNANPFGDGPNVVSVSGNCHPVKHEQQEESLVSVAEQMPKDSICEVTSDHAKDTEVVCVEVSEAVRDTSQDCNSGCSGSTSDI